VDESASIVVPPVVDEEGGPEVDPLGLPDQVSHGAREQVAEQARASAMPPYFEGETRWLAVRVRIQETWDDDSPRSPGVGFVVGIARGPQYAMGPLGEHKLLLARGASDAHGDARVELALPLEVLREWGVCALLWGNVAEPGKRADVRITTIPHAPDPANLKLLPFSGYTITGRVLRADGTPAHPADVYIFTAGLAEGEWKSDEDSAHVDAHGGFQLDVDEPGTYDVLAEAPGQGAAGLRDIEITGTDEQGILELTVTGDGVIAGVLLDPDGQPVPLYRLWCLPEAHRDESGGSLHRLQRLHHEWSGGLYGDHGETDELGRFRFAGLQPGSYHIRGHTAKTGYYEKLLTREAVPVGTLDLELRLARHRVLARVLDHRGKRVRVEPKHSPGRNKLAEHALYIEECNAEGRLLRAQRYLNETRERLANGDLVLDVEPGKRYILGIFSREVALVERRIEISPGDYEQLIVVQLPAPAPGTRLVVELQDPTGKPYQGTNTQRLFAPESGRLLLEVESYYQMPVTMFTIGEPYEGTNTQRLFAPESGRLPLEVESNDETRVMQVAIGPGRYHWYADAKPTRGGRWGGVGRWSATPFAPVTDELEVFAGRETRYERRLLGSGLLSLEVQASSPPPAPTPAEQETEEWQALGSEEQLRRSSVGASVRLVNAEQTLRPSFDLGYEERWLAHLGNPREGPWVILGKRAQTLDPIPPGRYRLIVELEGLGTREQTIEIRTGETTKVSLSFDN